MRRRSGSGSAPRAIASSPDARKISKRRKEEWSGNLARKEALCAKAEALADSTEWDSAAAQFKQLQAEWKTIGPVRKSRSEAIWQRFRAACDRFFDRFKHRDQLELQEKAAVRDTVIRELEALVPADGAAESPAPENLYTIVHQARSKWQQAPELPRALQQDLAARYHQAVGRLVAVWPARLPAPISIPKRRASGWRSSSPRVEEIVSAQPAKPANLSPTELLAQQLRERLAANTMSGGESRGRQRGVALARRRSRKCAARRHSGCASDRFRRTSPGRSTSASSARAAGSSTRASALRRGGSSPA